jgi:phage baseplate assembly protein W
MVAVVTRQADIIVPKLAFPFRLSASGKRALCVEQDSVEEIVACVEVLLRTELGSRVEAPTYGISDQAFRQGGASLNEIRNAIAMWESRADVTLEAGDIENLVQAVRVRFEGEAFSG